MQSYDFLLITFFKKIFAPNSDEIDQSIYYQESQITNTNSGNFAVLDSKQINITENTYFVTKKIEDDGKVCFEVKIRGKYFIGKINEIEIFYIVYDQQSHNYFHSKSVDEHFKKFLSDRNNMTAEQKMANDFKN